MQQTSPDAGTKEAAETLAYLAGDYDALLELPYKYRKRFEAFFRRRVPQRADAEDCVQETNAKLVDKRPKFDPSKGTFKAWAFTLARRILLHFYRKRKKLLPLIDTDTLVSQFVDFGLLDPSDEVGFTEFVERLRRSASKLCSDTEFTVFELWLKGYSSAEIAEELALTREQVYAIKYRMLKKLREIILGNRERIPGTDKRPAFET